ncbi:MAG: arsenosugar biosynthesis radical SAM (seleno)protein ArsS [Cyanobacteria bacterium J06648_11]
MTRSRTDTALHSCLVPFGDRLDAPLTKQPISVLQINLGRRCNLACAHCHVEAGPNRTEELSVEVCRQLVEVIQRFEQIQTVDLTGGAPEMNYGFRPLVEAARAKAKQVMVRSNLTIFFEKGYEDLPEYFARHQIHVVASLPCYLADNVDRMRGNGVFDRSVEALQELNRLGYGGDPRLKLDLVYNPQLPSSNEFSLTASQQSLEGAYKAHLQEQFGIVFNQLFTITNIPIGRTKFHLNRLDLHEPYLEFLSAHFNAGTVEHLMCRNELSVDYLGYIYDCDFNQMEGVHARDRVGNAITVGDLLDRDSLDLIDIVQTKPYCYGCTAGSGSSCGGALV